MAEPDRIVLINDASVARGGATGLAVLAAELLCARGHAVAFLSGDGGDSPRLTGAGVSVAGLGQGRLLDRGRGVALATGLWNTAARRFLADWIARHDTARTVYHLHGWAQILSPAVFAALAPVARRTIVHAHDFFLACPNGVYMDFPAQQPCKRVPMSTDCLATHCDKRSRAQKGWRVLRHGVMRRAFSASDWAALAMIHPAMAEPLARGGVPAEKLVALRNPADIVPGPRIRAEANRKIVFVGRLSEEKGPVDLARACAARALPVTFVGEGPCAAAIRAANPTAEITGWQDRAGVRRHLAQARALAMPSRLPEPFGLVAAEAARAGLPVILPDFALMADEVETAGIGRSYDPLSPGGLEAALDWIANRKESDLKAMSERAHGDVARLALTPGEWADGLERLYRAALGQPNE